MSSPSESDSKEDSVIESKPELRVRFTDTERRESLQKKFKGFYMSQKTIAAESDDANSSLDLDGKTSENEHEDDEEDKQEFLFEEVLDELMLPAFVTKKRKRNPKLKNIPKEDDLTDHSDVEVNEKDKETIARDHSNPGIDGSIKMSISNVTHKKTMNEVMDHLDVDGDTSEDEVSELVADAATTATKPSLKVDLTHTKKTLSFERSMSEESEIVVSDLDYYKIRHETDVRQDNTFCLSASMFNLSTRTNSFGDEGTSSDKQFSIPCIKMLDVKGRKGVDDVDTSDEDVSCMEADFMSRDEFNQAHTSDYDLTKREAKLMVSHSFSERSDVESEPEFTESIREDLDMSSESLDEFEMDTDSEELVASFAENGVEHSPGCIHSKIKHSPNCAFMKFVRVYDSYNGEDIEFEAENDQADKENISDNEHTNISELVDDDTDEENISDLDMDSIELRKKQVKKPVAKKTPKILVNGGLAAPQSKTSKPKSRRRRNRF